MKNSGEAKQSVLREFLVCGVRGCRTELHRLYLACEKIKKQHSK